MHTFSNHLTTYTFIIVKFCKEKTRKHILQLVDTYTLIITKFYNTKNTQSNQAHSLLYIHFEIGFYFLCTKEFIV